MQPIRFLDRTTPPHIATLILMPGLAALAQNVFLPSLPAMAAQFGVSYALMQLSVSLYLVMTALVQLFIGPLSDRFGRRPVLLWAIGIFVLATLGTLMAPDYQTFILCRMLQAIIAASFALSRAVVRDMVPVDQAASMIAYVTMGMSLVPMVGPVIGGLLDNAFGWQASFWLLAVVGVVVFALVYRDLGETATHRSASFAEQVRAYPELLRSQRFWGYCLSSAFASGAFFAFLGGAPFVGATVYGLSPTTVGFFFACPALGYLIGNFLSGRYSMRVGINRMIVLGAVVATVGLVVLLVLEAFGLSSAIVFPVLMIPMGMGNGLLLPSANAGMLSVRPGLAGSAAGLGAAITIAGGAALSVLAGVLLVAGSGAMPLILLMTITSSLSIASAYWVIRRARTIGLGA